MNSNIKDEVQRLARLNTTIANLSKRHSEGLQYLVKRLEQGESSGDPIFDFCTSCYGALGFDEAVRAPYVNLQEKLKGRKGQELLLVHSQEVPTGEGYHTVESEIQMKLKMGRLNSDKGLEFSVKDNSLVFSAEPYLTSEHNFPRIRDLVLLGGVKWNFAQGKLIVPHTELPHLAQPIINRMSYSSYPCSESQILVGEEVRNFFEGSASVGKNETYQKALELLSTENEVPNGV